MLFDLGTYPNPSLNVAGRQEYAARMMSLHQQLAKEVSCGGPSCMDADPTASEGLKVVAPRWGVSPFRKHRPGKPDGPLHTRE